MNFDIVIENKIREAIDEGLFDNLPGQGKPLQLDENPHEPAAWRIAYSMLKDNGYTLPWIDERRSIEEAIEKAVKMLAQTYRQTHRSKQPDVWDQSEWRRAAEAFGDVVTKLNKRIRDYNLQAPSLTVHRSMVDAAQEIARVEREAATTDVWKAAGQ